ncbi:MAG: pyridoxamine 5-phosphate oxidase [Rickettsiales bacterium]|nr:pyridoxamine 5-phosphate oxidase [Rickettsiales bacterium]|tara:strand:- start:14665 stop:15831 length:1167 start_codon:yes stop_codon:yes gene_type:complete
MKYPLATSSWDENEYKAIDSVKNSGFFSMNEKVNKFEKVFSNYLDKKYSVMVNSGSSANLLMIAALFFSNNVLNKLQPGDEIIVPSVSWGTTYFPLQQYGLKVKFVDIDSRTLNICLSKLKDSITDKTKAILLVNLLGNPNDINTIKKYIEGKDIVILEDNCESLGASFEGIKAGNFGLMSTHSFFFSHHISTMEGGMVSTDDEEIYHILLSLRAHGWTRNLPKKNLVTGIKSDDSFEESFKFVLPGYNLRPLEMSGAIGLEQMKKIGGIISGRRKNAKIFQELMFDNEYFDIQLESGKSSWFGFSLIIKKNIDLKRDKILNKLNNLGFETRPIVTGNFLKNPVIKYFKNFEKTDCPNSEYIDQQGFFIGNHHYDVSKHLKNFSNIKF